MAIWLMAAAAWVAGVTFALFALAQPAHAEFAFRPEAARLACADAAPRDLSRRGNSVVLPRVAEGAWAACRFEIDYTLSDPALAAQAATNAFVDAVALGLGRAAFAQRLPVNQDGIALAVQGDKLTLMVSAERVLALGGASGTALTLGLRLGPDNAAQSYLSPALLFEHAKR